MRCLLAVIVSVPLSGQTFFVRDARVFDGEQVLQRASVLVENGIITALGENLRAPVTAIVVEGKGKTLLPGLIDAHTHTASETDLKQALAFGVTTELDLFSPGATLRALRQAQHSEQKNEADVRSAGICATAPGGHGTEYNVPIPTLSKPEQAQSFVDDRLAEGSDYLKVIYTRGIPNSTRVFPNLNRETMAALIQAAHRRDRLAIVHVDEPDLAREAIEAGADVLAHIYVTPDEPAADPKIAILAFQHKTAVIPTLSIKFKACGLNQDSELVSDPRIADYLTASSHRNLTSIRRPPWFNCDGVKSTLTELRRAGIPLLAGTDVPNGGTAHGVSVHSEMAVLVQAGLPPLDALKAATSAPANVFRLKDRGRVAPGKRADLVLVNGDPTVDIRATCDIVAVWKQGWRFDREGYRSSVATLDAPLVPSGLRAGLVSNFDDASTRTAFGPSWEAFEGVHMNLVVGGAQGSHGSLVMSGDVKADRPAYLWPGMVFIPSGLRRVPSNLSSKLGLQFWAKGDGRTYRVVIVGEAGPQEKVFKPGPNWQEYRIAFNDFSQINPERVQAVILAASRDPGPFEIHLDEISFY